MSEVSSRGHEICEDHEMNSVIPVTHVSLSLFFSLSTRLRCFDMADIQVESKPLLVPPELTVRAPVPRVTSGLDLRDLDRMAFWGDGGVSVSG